MTKIVMEGGGGGRDGGREEESEDVRTGENRET